MTFEEAAAQAFDALSSGRAIADAWDGLADPAGLAAGLDSLASGAVAIVRVVREPSALLPATGDFGPRPERPSWARITAGSASLRVAKIGERGPELRDVTVTAVRVETLPADDAREAATARVLLEIQGEERLVVAEAWARTEPQARLRVEPAARSLGRALGIALAGATTEVSDPDADLAAGDALPKLDPALLARYTLTAEGPLLVLRDQANRGPRDKASVHLVVGLVFTAATIFAATQLGPRVLARTWDAVTLAWGVAFLLLTLSAVAFLGVSRFAFRYSAISAPLATFGGGKLTVAPWVGRDGSVGLAPEGRWGAGIDFVEVHGTHVREHLPAHAVEVATDHGPIDALLASDPRVAAFWSAVMNRILDDLSPENPGETSKQRARRRAR